MKNKKHTHLNLPTDSAIQSAARPNRLEIYLLHWLWLAMRQPPIQIKLWDGTLLGAMGDKNPVMVITSRKTLWRFLLNPNINFGDDYSVNNIEIEGSLLRFMEAVFSSRPSLRQGGRLKRYLMNRPRIIRKNNLGASRGNIHHHYDLGNEFYHLWLDQELLYTCAYFKDANMSLEAAQQAKMEHVCRKLRLKPGDEVVEAGCGWGALSLHMARRWGVHVKAFNISREQIKWARERAAREGLSRQVEFIEDDYRNISGACDVFVSVGMLEHVGRDQYKQMGEVIHRCLKPEGRGLLHSIGQLEPRPMTGWIEKRIFPGAYPPTLSEMVRLLELWQLAVLDVENLRLHYAMTLDHWWSRFEQNVSHISLMYDPTFVRAWRLYLAGSLAHFNIGALQLFQVVFSRATNNDIPLTRADLYRAGVEKDEIE